MIKSVFHLINLDRIELLLTRSTMIWCDSKKEEDCRKSLAGFWLNLPYALSYHPLLFETTKSCVEISYCKKNAFSFIWINFQTIFIIPFFALCYGLSLRIFLAARDRCATEQELNIVCVNGCTSGNSWWRVNFRNVIDKKKWFFIKVTDKKSVYMKE